MPLPDAPPVETSRIYQQFKGLNSLGNTVGAITADLMDNVRLQQFVDFNSEDELRRLLLVGMASQTMSVSGPMANTGIIKSVTRTTDGTDTVFQPGAGETWQLVAADATATGGVRFKFQLYDGSTTIEINDTSVTSSTVPIDLTTVPIHIDQSMYLRINISSLSGSDSGTVNVGFVRVR